MNKDQFEREKSYEAALSIAKSLLTRGIISEKEYGKIDTILLAGYHPIFGGLRAKST